MNQTSKNIDELLIRILDDTATRADLRVFAEWIRTEENRKYFEQYKKIWHTTTGVQCDDQVVEEGWQDYKQFMRALPERRKKSGCFAKSVAICGDRGCDPVMCLFLFETDWKHG